MQLSVPTLPLDLVPVLSAGGAAPIVPAQTGSTPSTDAFSDLLSAETTSVAASASPTLIVAAPAPVASTPVIPAPAPAAPGINEPSAEVPVGFNPRLAGARAAAPEMPHQQTIAKWLAASGLGQPVKSSGEADVATDSGRESSEGVESDLADGSPDMDRSQADPASEAVMTTIFAPVSLPLPTPAAPVLTEKGGDSELQHGEAVPAQPKVARGTARETIAASVPDPLGAAKDDRVGSSATPVLSQADSPAAPAAPSLEQNSRRVATETPSAGITVDPLLPSVATIAASTEADPQVKMSASKITAPTRQRGSRELARSDVPTPSAASPADTNLSESTRVPATITDGLSTASRSRQVEIRGMATPPRAPAAPRVVAAESKVQFTNPAMAPTLSDLDAQAVSVAPVSTGSAAVRRTPVLREGAPNVSVSTDPVSHVFSPRTQDALTNAAVPPAIVPVSAPAIAANANSLSAPEPAQVSIASTSLATPAKPTAPDGLDLAEVPNGSPIAAPDTVPLPEAAPVIVRRASDARLSTDVAPRVVIQPNNGADEFRPTAPVASGGIQERAPTENTVRREMPEAPAVPAHPTGAQTRTVSSPSHLSLESKTASPTPTLRGNEPVSEITDTDASGFNRSTTSSPERSSPVSLSLPVATPAPIVHSPSIADTRGAGSVPTMRRGDEAPVEFTASNQPVRLEAQAFTETRTPQVAPEDATLLARAVVEQLPRTGGMGSEGRVAASVTNTAGVESAEKIAGPSQSSGDTSGEPGKQGQKKSLNASSQRLANEPESLGINAAKPGFSMPVAAHSTSIRSEIEATASSVAPVTFDALSRETTTPPSEIVQAARRAVDSAMAVVDQYATADKKSVNLQFNVSGVDLAVRVELRGENVHTTFRTDSSELRNALAHEWQVVSSTQVGDRPQRLADPVFTSSATGSTSGNEFGSATQHRDSGARQNPAAAPEYSGFRNATRSPAMTTAAPTSMPAPRSIPASTSGRLNTFA